MSQHFRGSKLKVRVLQHPCTECAVMIECNFLRDKKFMSHDKNFELSGVLTCRVTPFAKLVTSWTFLTVTSKSCYPSYFEHSSS